MPWKKANKDLIALLEKQMEKYICERRPMFGSPTFFVRGNMFAGVHEDTVILRLSQGDQKTLFSSYNEVTPFTPMGGRVMRDYVALPLDFCLDSELFERWIEWSYQYANSLPQKQSAKTTKRKKA